MLFCLSRVPSMRRHSHPIGPVGRATSSFSAVAAPTCLFVHDSVFLFREFHTTPTPVNTCPRADPFYAASQHCLQYLDAACCYRCLAVSWFAAACVVCLLVTIVSRAKVDEPIEMSFACVLGWAQDGGSESPARKCSFGGFQPVEKYWDFLLCLMHMDRCTSANGSFFLQ